MRRAFLTGLALILCMPGPAGANVALDLGLGTMHTAMGGASCAAVDDFAAVHYNPAGLAWVDRAHVGFVSIYARPHVYVENVAALRGFHQIQVMRGIGGGIDVIDPLLVEPEATFGAVVGIAADLGYLAGLERAAIGCAVYLPYRSLVKTPVVSSAPTTPHLVFYTDRLVGPVFQFGAAWRLLKGLSIGAAVNIMTDLAMDTYAAVTLDASEGGIVEGLNNPIVVPVVNREMRARIVPHVGLQWKPADSLEMGLTYRGEIRARSEGSQHFAIDLIAPATGERVHLLDVDLDPLVFVNFFTPRSMTIGVAVKPVDRVMIALDFAWNDWSAFVDGSGTSPDAPFRDTLVPRLGLRFAVTGALSIGIGYFFQPSPVPDQLRGSNYIDLDKHVASIGWTYRLPRPVLGKRRLEVGGYLQFHEMVRRRYTKESTGETVMRYGVEYPEYGPNYAVSADLVSFGVGCTLLF